MRTGLITKLRSKIFALAVDMVVEETDLDAAVREHILPMESTTRLRRAHRAIVAELRHGSTESLKASHAYRVMELPIRAVTDVLRVCLGAHERVGRPSRQSIDTLQRRTTYFVVNRSAMEKVAIEIERYLILLLRVGVEDGTAPWERFRQARRRFKSQRHKTARDRALESAVHLLVSDVAGAMTKVDSLAREGNDDAVSEYLRGSELPEWRWSPGPEEQRFAARHLIGLARNNKDSFGDLRPRDVARAIVAAAAHERTGAASFFFKSLLRALRQRRRPPESNRRI